MPLHRGDRLVLLESARAGQGRGFYEPSQVTEKDAFEERFIIVEIPLAPESLLIVRGLSEGKFPKSHRVTVIGTQWDGRSMRLLRGNEIPNAGDRLIASRKS